MDFANIALTVVLSLIALVVILGRVLLWVLNYWGVSEGLIRPRRRGEPASNHWPNGWHNLPDTLEGIYSKIQQLEAHSDVTDGLD
jgi:hypothetical protein